MTSTEPAAAPTRTRAWIAAAVVSWVGLGVGLLVDVPDAVALLAPPDSPVITVHAPDGGEVPRCYRLAGQADVVDGMVLWEAHFSRHGRYFFKRPIVEHGGRWQLSIIVGDENAANETFVIQLFYLPEATSAFLDGVGGIGRKGDDGQGFARALPPDAAHVRRLTVRRDDTPRAPACG